MLRSKPSPRRRAAIIVQVLRGVELPTQFLLTIIAANTMGPELFGSFGVLLACQAVLIVIAAFGYDELLQRAISRDPDQLQTHATTALGARTRSALVVVGLGALTASVSMATAGNPDLALAILLLALATAGSLVSSIFSSIAVSASSVTIPFSASLLSWVAPLILALSGLVFSLSTFAAALALGSLIRVILSLLWATKKLHLRGPVSEALLISFRVQLLEPPKSHVSILIYALNNQILARHGDMLIAGLLGVSLALLGSYSLAFQITAMANTFLMMGLGTIALSFLAASSKNPKEMGQSWRRISGVAALIAVGPISILALVAPELVSWIFADNYPLLTELILALCVAQWANRVGGGGTNTGSLIAAGMSTTVARTSVGGAVLNITLNLILVPWLGVFGLVAGTGLSVLTIGILNSVALSRALQTRPPLSLLFGLSICVIGSVALAAVETDTFWRLAMAAVILVVWTLALLRSFKSMKI